MAEYLNAFLYMPNIENMLATTSTRFRQFRNLHGTKDSSQIFTKTRKDLKMQSYACSEYIYHNTSEFQINFPNFELIHFKSLYWKYKRQKIEIGWWLFRPYSAVFQNIGR